jgi:hypothetical protein
MLFKTSRVTGLAVEVAVLISTIWTKIGAGALHALVPFSRMQAAPLAYRCRGRRLHERLGLHSPPSVLPPIPELRKASVPSS